MTVAVPTSHRTAHRLHVVSEGSGGRHSAYREVGTYRGAAETCGTNHQTVRRTVERAKAGGLGRATPADRPHN